MALGKLGILKGKKATCYPGFEQYLEGAKCVSQHVVRDGNIITGMGPGAAVEFALALVELLVGKEKADELVDAMCMKRSQHVVRDGNIITGMGPGAAVEFALALVELLVGKEKADELVDAMCMKR